MSSSNKLLMGSASNILIIILQVISGFIVMPITIQALGDSMFGIWTLVAAFMGYYGLMDFGLSGAVSRFVSRAIGQKSGRDISYYTASAFYIFLGICGTAILITLIATHFTQKLFPNPDELQVFNNLLLIFCLNLLITYPCNIFNGCLVSHLRYDIVNGLRILTTSIRLIGTIVLLKHGYGVYALAILSVISNTIENVPAIFFAYKIEKNLSIRWSDFNKKKLKELFGYSIFSYIANISDVLRFQIAPFFITAYVTVAAVTHYRVGSRLMEFYVLFIVAVFGVLTPYFSQKHGEGDSAVITKNLFFAIKISVLLSGFIGFSIIFYGGKFIEVWMGDTYQDSYQVLSILVLGYIFALMQNPSISFLYGIGKQKFVAYSNLIEALINLGLSILLIKHYGVLGAAVSISLPMFISKLIVLPLFVSGYLKVKYADYMLRILLGPLLLSLIVFSIFALVIKMQLQASYLSIFVWGSVHTLLFALSSYFLILKSDDRERIVGLVKKILRKG